MKVITTVPRPIVAVYYPEENNYCPELKPFNYIQSARALSTSPFRFMEGQWSHIHKTPEDSNLLDKTFTVGVLDIFGIYTDYNSIPDGVKEGMLMGAYNELELHIKNQQHVWHNWKPLKRHISEVLMNADNGWNVTVVYGTRNCADNINIQDVISIMHCLFDGATIERI
jgi:hypothetical protein